MAADTIAFNASHLMQCVSLEGRCIKPLQFILEPLVDHQQRHQRAADISIA